MFRHRFAAAAICLSLFSLAACGDDGDSSSKADGDASAALDAVEITPQGDKEPKVEWTGDFKPSELESEVLVKGEGPVTKEGDTIRFHAWIGNGFSEKQVLSTYDDGGLQVLELTKDLSPALIKAMTGHPVGSLVAVAAPAADAFGEQGNPQIGLGEGDSVLIVANVVEQLSDKEVKKLAAADAKAAKAQEKAQKKADAQAEKGKKNALKTAKGTKVKPAAWAPKVTFKDGEVPLIDFAGTPKPTGKLQISQVIKGKGKKVKSGQTLVAHYVGQVYEGDAPFDSSYSRGDVATFPIGVGQVIEGWDKALVGQPIGSRVIVQIPPELGYGEEGNAQAGIKGTDTLVFVVDILGAF